MNNLTSLYREVELRHPGALGQAMPFMAAIIGKQVESRSQPMNMPLTNPTFNP